MTLVRCCSAQVLEQTGPQAGRVKIPSGTRVMKLTSHPRGPIKDFA